MRVGRLKEGRRPVRTVDQNSVEFHELMDSMELMGQLVPILILPDGTVIDGHRRLLAARRLRWDEVSTVTHKLQAQEVLAAQIRLNDLSLNEYRLAVSRLIDENQLDKLTSVGYALGRNVDWVAEVLGLATLSNTVRKSVDKGLVSVKVAMFLAKLPKGRQRELLADSINNPDSELIPQLQDEVRHKRETKLDARLTRRGNGGTWLRTERVVHNEVLTPTDAMRTLAKHDARTPLEGWTLALKWALQIDPDSLSERNNSQ